jgi:hypothetical protein
MKTSCAESSEKNYRLSIRKYEKEHSRNKFTQMDIKKTIIILKME